MVQFPPAVLEEFVETMGQAVPNCSTQLALSPRLQKETDVYPESPNAAPTLVDATECTDPGPMTELDTVEYFSQVAFQEQLVRPGIRVVKYSKKGKRFMRRVKLAQNRSQILYAKQSLGGDGIGLTTTRLRVQDVIGLRFGVTTVRLAPCRFARYRISTHFGVDTLQNDKRVARQNALKYILVYLIQLYPNRILLTVHEYECVAARIIIARYNREMDK